MTVLLDHAVVVPFLAEIGITPQGTPAAFDVAQRELTEWFAAGGTVREWQERNRHRDWESRGSVAALPRESLKCGTCGGALYAGDLARARIPRLP